MALFQSLLHKTNFHNPLLQTLVPSIQAVFIIQTAFAIPSIIAQTEKFYDFSGALTYLSVTALSLYLPALRDRYATGIASKAALPSLLSPFKALGGTAAFNWRQVALSGAVAIWAIRLGLYLFHRILKEGKDSRFDRIRGSPSTFLVVWIAQAAWVSVSLLPAIAVNSIPATAFAAIPVVKVSDVVGLSLFAGGLLFEVIADWQKSKWIEQKKAKIHDEEFLTRGLWSRSRYPNYFGESTLWTGIATVSAGLLLARPIQAATGLKPLAAIVLSYISPVFATFLLLRISGVPLSERKYDKLYGGRSDYQAWKRDTPMFFPKIF